VKDEPASIANDFCPYGEEQGAGCVKEAGHDGDHAVTTGESEDEATKRQRNGGV
jgi:hypothetical protein